MSWISRDWGLKLISLVLAIGLWYYAVGEEGIEIDRIVPLQLQVANEQMSILNASTNTIKVTLNVPRGMLSNIASQEITAAHIIGEDVKKAGDYSFRLQASDIALPAPYVRIVNIEPEVVNVTLDELITKKVEIKANFSGDPAFGYRVHDEEIQLNPNAILIQGPKAQLGKLDFVKTQAIDLVGRIRSFRRTVGLDLPTSVKPLNEALIDVLIPIKEEFGEKEFEDVLVRLLRNPEESRRIEIDPKTISFTLNGSRRRLEELQKESILAFLDVAALEWGEHTVKVSLVLPEEVSLQDDSEIMVKTTVEKL